MSKDFEENHSYPNEKKGSEYILVGDYYDFDLGEIFELIQNDDGCYSLFESLNGGRAYLFWKDLERLKRTEA
jgi:hypothetical protein